MPFSKSMQQIVNQITSDPICTKRLSSGSDIVAVLLVLELGPTRNSMEYRHFTSILAFRVPRHSIPLYTVPFQLVLVVYQHLYLPLKALSIVMILRDKSCLYSVICPISCLFIFWQQATHILYPLASRMNISAPLTFLCHLHNNQPSSVFLPCLHVKPEAVWRANLVVIIFCVIQSNV